jgi:hypothetical protein
MTVHFEDLWGQCEKFHQENVNVKDLQPIIEALLMKVNLYKSLSNQKDIPGDEMQKLKSRLLGELVFALTCISLKDDINVFEALAIALQHRTIDVLDKKYPV